MEINLKDDIVKALKTLAANQSKSVETFLEELIKSAAGKHQPTLMKDSKWATIYDTGGRNWQPRFDADITDVKQHQDELDRLRAREDMARAMAIARHRRDVPSTNDADKAYAAYVERLKSGKR